MNGLFSIGELLGATGGRAQNITVKSISSISIDSRSLESGALFVAIKGDQFDGHDYVRKALENGAAVALVNEARASEFTDLAMIVVPDALAGMVDIARAARKRSKAKIIAITGSAGKTTTKSMVQLILSEFGQTHASIKSYNNHWGVPLMLANMSASAEFGVFEIGMNHGGEITPLVELVRPHIALVTNVGPAHIGNFESIEAIARAKAEIFSGLMPGGIAIINADHGQVDVLLKAVRTRGDIEAITYGFSKSADIRIFDYFPHNSGARAQTRFGVVSVNFEIFVPGQHMLINALGALCIANLLELDFGQAVDALAEFRGSEGRGAIIELGSGGQSLTLIDESYNANPASMTAALEVFGAQVTSHGRKILVLGDMLELGDESARYHGELCDDILSCGVDRVYLVGKQMMALKSFLADRIEVAGDAENVVGINEILLNDLDYGDIIMVKGSLGVGLGRIVLAIRDRFAGALQT